jgi:hypothetical protein
MSDLAACRLPEERGWWEGEINKYLEDIEARAALTAGVEW